MQPCKFKYVNAIDFRRIGRFSSIFNENLAKMDGVSKAILKTFCENNFKKLSAFNFMKIRALRSSYEV